MATNEVTLNETVAAIADAIREKIGKSELIAPVNFASEIKSISVGGGSGGGESGGIKLMYLNLAPVGGVPMVGVKDAFGEFNPIAKTTFNNSPVIIPLATTALDDERMVDAVALFIGVRTLVGGGSDITTSEAILDSKIPEWPDLQITEAEFYDLNA
jgi:hypothetical protein